jgi:hypothetical protein
MRNHDRYGGWILIDTSAARTLWHANHIYYRPGYDWAIGRLDAHYDGAPIPDARSTAEDPVGSYRELLSSELAYIARNPVLTLKRLPEKIGAFWNPTTFIQRALARNLVPRVPGQSTTALVASLVITGAYAALLVLGIFGLFHASRSPLRSYFLLLLATFTVVHSVLVCLSRYRLPLLPFLAVFAAYALLNPKECFRMRSPRTWAAVVVLALLAVLWWPYAPFVLMQKLHAW